jgi:hypothetical protein
MALFQESNLRNLATQKTNSDRRYSYEGYTRDSVQKSLLLESSVNFNNGKRDFDIFLSHCFSDKELVLGLRIKLESYGYSVYVDWIDDSGLDRTNVTVQNVLSIKQRMRCSKCLLYATSSNSSNSKWMPWETGYMDGFSGRVAIIPVASSVLQSSYAGTEYLGSYPYIEEAPIVDTSNNILRVQDQNNRKLYAQFSNWLKNGTLKYH